MPPTRAAPTAASPPTLAKQVVHCDLDTFFVAVERLRDPALVGLPVLIGGRGPRSVAATASYETRVFVCHSAQPMSQALRLCPQAVVVPPDFVAYGAASSHFHETLRTVSPLVEDAGLDEAYVDLTGIGEGPGAAHTAGETIRAHVREATGLAVSVGIASGRTTAKVRRTGRSPTG